MDEALMRQFTLGKCEVPHDSLPAGECRRQDRRYQVRHGRRARRWRYQVRHRECARSHELNSAAARREKKLQKRRKLSVIEVHSFTPVTRTDIAPLADTPGDWRQPTGDRGRWAACRPPVRHSIGSTRAGLGRLPRTAAQAPGTEESDMKTQDSRGRHAKRGRGNGYSQSVVGLAASRVRVHRCDECDLPYTSALASCR